MADRIQARAIRRCGELLKQIEPQSHAQLKQNRQEGALPSVTRESAATEAGLSEHQRKQSLRVANVPEDWINAALRICESEPDRRMGDVVAAVQAARENPVSTHEEAGAKGGRGNKAADNVSSFEYGNRADYTLRRLARDRPDLLVRVETGELSPSAALAS